MCRGGHTLRGLPLPCQGRAIGSGVEVKAVQVFPGFPFAPSPLRVPQRLLCPARGGKGCFGCCQEQGKVTADVTGEPSERIQDRSRQDGYQISPGFLDVAEVLIICPVICLHICGKRLLALALPFRLSPLPPARLHPGERQGFPTGG